MTEKNLQEDTTKYQWRCVVGLGGRTGGGSPTFVFILHLKSGELIWFEIDNC